MDGEDQWQGSDRIGVNDCLEYELGEGWNVTRLRLVCRLFKAVQLLIRQRVERASGLGRFRAQDHALRRYYL